MNLEKRKSRHKNTFVTRAQKDDFHSLSPLIKSNGFLQVFSKGGGIEKEKKKNISSFFFPFSQKKNNFENGNTQIHEGENVSSVIPNGAKGHSSIFLNSGANFFGRAERSAPRIEKSAEKNEKFSFFSEQSVEKKKDKFYKSSAFPQKSSNSTLSRFLDTQKQQQVVSITYEEIGLFPRSFNRVFDRFFKQLFFDVENFVIQEYRFYRYLFLTTVKCLFILLFVPLSINFLAKNYFIRPITEYFWNTQNHEIFLNSYQQKRAFSEFKNFEEKIYFESFLFSDTSNSFKKDIHFEKLKNEKEEKDKLYQSGVSTRFSGESPEEIRPPLHSASGGRPFPGVLGTPKPLSSASNPSASFFSTFFCAFFKEKTRCEFFSAQSAEKKREEKKEKKGLGVFSASMDFSTNFQNTLQKRLQTKIIELAKHYNEESIEAVSNFFADILSFATLWFLLVRLEIQINITKSFLLEVFFGLDDSKKSLLLLFLTDLLVGYHSPNIWELFFQTLFDHYGLPESQTTIFLLVATLPVLLDVLFKYLIFRHLNRASPATVATYHAMIE